MTEQREHRVDDIYPKGIRVRLVDASGEPIKETQYRLKLGDGSTQEVVTTDDGVIYIGSEAQGDIEMEVALPEEAHEGAEC